MTLCELNDAAALATDLAASLPAGQQAQGQHVAQAFDYAMALIDEMGRRLRLAQGALNGMAATATRTIDEIAPTLRRDTE